MTRSRGRSGKGQRLNVGIPHGHWKTTTFVAGLRLDGMVGPMVLDGPINREAFIAYVEQILGSDLRPGDIVIMDNLPAHKTRMCARRLKQQVHRFSISRPIALTSIPSKMPSPK